MAQESVLRIVIDSRNAERNAHALANELESIEKKGDFATKSMDSMSVATRQLAGYMAGIVTISAAINKIDTYTGINNKLKLVTNSQQELNQAMQDTFAIAQKSASSWGAVNDVYSKYMSNAKTLNLTQEQTARLTEITSKAVAISGSTTESAAGALFQYGQALDGNILRGEEYNALVDGAGGLLSAMAKGLGVTRGELRQMMLDGKLTGEVITKALLKAGDSVDELFNKTDVTIGQSLTVLSDSITKFTGEAASGSGAATVLAGSIKVLAENLDLIADGAIVLGIGYVTTAIATKTVAVKADIAATLTQRAATQAQAIEEVKLATAAVNDAKAHLALTQATAAATQAKFGATAAATKYKMATDAVTQAVIRQEAAEKAAFGSTVNMSRASAGLLGFLGGPAGIGLTLATVAAGYILMRDNAEKATASIDIQGQSVDDLVVKYRALNTLQRDNETKALSDQVEDLSLKFRVASSDLTSFMQALPVSDEKINTWSKLHSQFSLGKISSNEYYESIKALNILNIDQLNKVRGLINGYEFSNTKMKEAEAAQKALASAAKKTTGDLKDQAVGVANLDEKLKALLSTATSENNKNKIWINNIGASADVWGTKWADFVEKFKEANKLPTDKALGTEQLKIAQEQFLVLQKRQNLEEKISQAAKNQTKELEKQQKIMQVNSKVQALSTKYNISAKANAAGIPSGVIEAMIMQESKGNKNAVGPVTRSGERARGLAQFMPATAKQYGVNVFDEQSSINGMIKYMSALIKQFGGDVNKAIMAYNAGPGNVQSGAAYGFKETKNYLKNVKSYAAGFNGFSGTSKEFDSVLKDAEDKLKEQADLRKKLELGVADEVKRINEKLKDDLKSIDDAKFDPKDAEKLKAEYQSRADNEIAIALYTLKTKLDDYSSFKKTESQLLEDSFNEKKFYAARDIELTKEQRDKAVALLDEQLKQEQALIKLAYETRLFQMREAFMSETAAMQERYRLEREQILLNSKLSQEQKQREIALSKALQEEENRKRLNSAVQQWGGIQAEMNGTGDQYRLEQERFGRYGASQDVFDAQMSQVDQAAQDPNANMQELAAQREAIWQEHHNRMTAIESDYQASSYSLQLGYGQQVTGALSGMFGAMLGESSSAYRALYGAQQAFALAQVGMNVWKSASDAYANEPGTVWQKIGAAAKATLDQGTFVALIQAATPKGFANGGYTGHGGKYEPAGVVHKGEGVLTQEEVKALGGPQGFEDLRKSIRRGYATGGLVADTHRVGMGAVSAINPGGGNSSSSGGGDVYYTQTIHIASDGSATSEYDAKQLGKMMENMTLAVIRREQRQGGLLSK
ncbi:tape measure protein [Acinetobacter sp. CS-2]|uniref:tape measure protein n=1 Tax=Acinetobacter sp. CS-2 TaxID=2798861 RepID=UPI001908D6F4|nr:tape measure protein [Acinetobacter sp. CS-2]QQN40558.1 transglycosylase SLT domain-containing protein [Acinetobacter sp. CS-2]